MNTKIKICGLTSPDEVKYLQHDGVAYAGLVMFYEKSKRNNTPETAKPIISALKDLNNKKDKDIKEQDINKQDIKDQDLKCQDNKNKVKIVAVTVSPTFEQIKIIEELGFDIVQIHGELKEDVLNNTNIPIFRAYNLSDDLLNEDLINQNHIKGILFDGKIPGGGKSFDWSLLKDFDRNNKLLILAGGLDDSNVSQAIEEVKPDIVDVSSGVEYLDLKMKGKDPHRITAFISAVYNAKC